MGKTDKWDSKSVWSCPSAGEQIRSWWEHRRSNPWQQKSMSWNCTICHLQTDKASQERVFVDYSADSILHSQSREEYQGKRQRTRQTQRQLHFF